MQSRSAPAAIESTAASGMPRVADAPAMSRASLTITPRKPSRSRSSPRIVALSVAGSSGSSAGTTTCEVITAAVPASIAAANGTSSRAASVDMSTFSTGSARWLSTAVSPCPGKCLAHAATPADCSPRVHAATWTAASDAEDPKLRVPITGLSALEFTSATGPRSRVMPTRGELEADRPPDRPGQREVVGRTERQRPEHRAPVGHVQPGDVAALLVDRDHGPGRDGAHVGGVRRDRVRAVGGVGAEQAEPAQPLLEQRGARRPAPSSR